MNRGHLTRNISTRYCCASLLPISTDLEAGGLASLEHNVSKLHTEATTHFFVLLSRRSKQFLMSELPLYGPRDLEHNVSKLHAEAPPVDG